MLTCMTDSFDAFVSAHCTHIKNLRIGFSWVQWETKQGGWMVFYMYFYVAKRWRKIAGFSIYNYDETKNSLHTGAELNDDAMCVWRVVVDDMVYDIKTLHCSLQFSGFFFVQIFFSFFFAFVFLFQFLFHPLTSRSLSLSPSFRFFYLPLLFGFSCAHCAYPL